MSSMNWNLFLVIVPKQDQLLQGAGMSQIPDSMIPFGTVVVSVYLSYCS